MCSDKPDSFRTLPSATGGIARLACARLREAGKDVAAVLAKAGLKVEMLDDPTLRLEVNAQIKVLNLAAAELDDQLLGFHLARSFELGRIGLLYYVMASSEQLADALRNAGRYSRIVNEGVRLHFTLDKTATISLDYVDVDRSADRHQAEFWLVTLIRICRQVTETRLAPLRLKVRHRSVGPTEELKSFFGHDMEFEQDADAIIFPAQTASLPVVGRDVYLNELLRQYADEALARQPDRQASFRSAVEKVIPQLLPHGRARTAEVAGLLGMSLRTLSRKLHDEGASYAEILDELRAALAKRYLRESELPVSEIAWLLGYMEISSLTHAFRRWTGMTPRQFRSSDCDRR
jgi:AraC-like DNA-binding protein